MSADQWNQPRPSEAEWRMRPALQEFVMPGTDRTLNIFKSAGFFDLSESTKDFCNVMTLLTASQRIYRGETSY